MNRKIKILFILILVLLVISIILNISFFVNKQQTKTTKENNSSETKNNKASSKLGCSRIIRLDNEPQYDRALSLIQQRLKEHNKTYKSKDDSYYYKYFSPELVNCIKIIEATPKKRDDFEGYFILNSEEIKPDYYPIIVNSKYVESDDIGIVLLLSHELTHVQQYINAVNNKKETSCLDNEANAFMATRMFYIFGLNFQETGMVDERIKTLKSLSNKKGTGIESYYQNYMYTSFDTPFTMIDLVQKLVGESKCQTMENIEKGLVSDCLDSDIHNKLKEIIKNDSYYKKQCGL